MEDVVALPARTLTESERRKMMKKKRRGSELRKREGEG